MRNHGKTMRQRAANAALGSVKAEGLKPTKATIDDINLWVLGHIQPVDASDVAELEFLVGHLFEKEYHKRLDKTEQV